MAISVRQAINAKSVYGLSATTTTTASFAEVITQAQLRAAGAEVITRIRVVLLMDDGYLYPSAGVEDLSAQALAGQAEVAVDDSSIFEVGRAVYLLNAAGQDEWGVIASINSTTDTLTLTENLTYTYATDEDCMEVPCINAGIPMYRGVPLNEDGLYWKGIAIQRRLDQNVTIEGYTVVF